MLIIFTGNGKGKTTAALGQAIRALGQGKRVLTIQFIKGNWESGEHKFFKQIANRKARIVIRRAGKGFIGILGDRLPFLVHKKAAEEALALAKKSIKSGKWDLIILDEINVAVSLRLIKVAEVLKILHGYEIRIKYENTKLQKNKSQHFFLPDIILTGRDAPKSFIKIADLVTEMKEIKHPFKKGKLAKKGIEY